MAPRPPQQRRTIAPQEHIYELGVAGRKTGITLKDTGVRDEHGMEPLDALFSSPRKTGANSDDDSDEDGSGEPMELTTNLGAGPAALLSGPAKRLSFPLPLSRSPVKTSLNSPAQRNRLLARSSSPTHGGESSFRDHHSQPAPKSRLGPKKADANGSSSQPLFGRGMPKLSATNNGFANGHRRYDPSIEDSDAEEEPVDDVQGLHSDDVGAYVEESMAMLTAETELNYDDDDDDVAAVEEEAPAEESEDEPTPPPRAANSRKQSAPKPKLTNGAPPAKRGRPAKAAPVVDEEDSDADVQPAEPPARRGRPAKAPVVEEDDSDADVQPAEPPARRGRPAKAPVVEEEDSDADIQPAEPPARRGRPPKPQPEPVVEEDDSDVDIQNDPEPEQDVESEEEEEAPPPPPRRKAGKEKAKAPTPEPQPQPPARKRRSLTEVEAEEEASPRQNKRQRTEEPAEPPAKKRGRPPKSAEASTSKASSSKPPAPAPKAKRGRKRKSSLGPGDTSQVAIPRGPPLPKARGLLITRCEVPGQANSAIKQTRSGRNSMRPLAFWRNEHVEYEYGTASASTASAKYLPSIKEVVRIDEPEREYAPRGGGGKRGPKSKKGNSSSSRRESYAPPPEPWEADAGVIDGAVIAWRAEHEFNPPAPDGMVATEMRELAIAGTAVETQPVKDANFRYAKTLNEGFFNCGVVELPPGSEKRPKNSRKMFMSFFLHEGRVLVTVNETSFRIGKGGMWFVPRGNYYSIENDYDQPARIFFSQGCEVAPRPASPSPELEAEEEDEDEEDDGDEGEGA
ncbi:centromere protein 3 [Podospora conica]|nr:centromere protein 3 [Schizothecium conicum]